MGARLEFLVVTNLCAAGIVCIAPRIWWFFSGHAGGTGVYGICVGSKAFCIVRTTNVLDQMNLGLGLSPSSQLSSLMTPGSSFIVSGLCRNKFDANFRVAVGWTKNTCLGLDYPGSTNWTEAQLCGL